MSLHASRIVFPRGVIRFLAPWLLCLPLVAHAALVVPSDLTGVWMDEHHPGWGLGLVQQNDTVFATLFIYDALGAPAWLVGTLQAASVDFDPCGSATLTGALYRTQWPSFGSVADPHGSFQAQSVGTLAVRVATTQPAQGSVQGCDRNTAALQYSIDGVQSTASVTRETWSSNQPRLYGQYSAGLVVTSPGAPCPDLGSDPLSPFGGRQLLITAAADDTTPGGMHLVWGTGIDTACVIVGTYSQHGQLGKITGSILCGPVGNSGVTGNAVEVSDLHVSDSGFGGTLALTTSSCRYPGTIAGARRP